MKNTSRLFDNIIEPFPNWYDGKQFHPFDEKQWWNAVSDKPTKNKKCVEEELKYYRKISYNQMKEMKKWNG